MAITKINADAMDLTDAYAFTGTVTGAGQILQVVTAYGTSSTNAGTSYVTVADTSITITPSATSSRIHLAWNTGATANDASGVNAIAIKGVSSEDGTIFEMYRYAYSNNSSHLVPCPLFVTYVDSPNSTSAITYSLQAKCGVTNGWSSNPDGGSNQVRVIAMEIGV
mgnify:CR=1 FL=1